MPSPRRLGAALLAIPVAGILHVIGRDLYDGYRGRLKTEPAIAQEEVPMSYPTLPGGQGALMERERLDEQEAFTHLRRAARSRAAS